MDLGLGTLQATWEATLATTAPILVMAALLELEVVLGVLEAMVHDQKTQDAAASVVESQNRLPPNLERLAAKHGTSRCRQLAKVVQCWDHQCEAQRVGNNVRRKRRAR